MKFDIALYEGSDHEPKFEYVHTPFHTKEITGLDVCIRKQLIVTCSRDKTIRIWNYVNKTLDISHQLTEEVIAVAFHPSGFHIIVAVADKITIMNVLSKQLSTFRNFPVKQCKEISFSNGGHLFAAGQHNFKIFIYNFYTNE